MIEEMMKAVRQNNPGAWRVCEELRSFYGDERAYKDFEELSKCEIIGSELWLLYSDCCNFSIEHLHDALESGIAIGMLEIVRGSHFYREGSEQKPCEMPPILQAREAILAERERREYEVRIEEISLTRAIAGVSIEGEAFVARTVCTAHPENPCIWADWAVKMPDGQFRVICQNDLFRPGMSISARLAEILGEPG